MEKEELKQIIQTVLDERKQAEEKKRHYVSYRFWIITGQILLTLSIALYVLLSMQVILLPSTISILFLVIGIASIVFGLVLKQKV